MAERNISFTAHQTKTSQPEGFLLRHQWTILPIALAILDGLTVFGVLNLAFNIRFKLNLPIFRTEVMDSPAYYLNLECAMVIAVLVMFLLAGLYNISNLLAGMREYSLVFNCVVILVVLILVVSFLIPAFVISRGWLVMAWLFTFLGVDIERFIFRRFIHQISCLITHRHKGISLMQNAAPRGFRTFVIIWLGQSISLIGSGLTGFALGVWVYQRTGSATQFTLIALATALPGIVFSPIAGALVDRWDRKWAMILSDTAAGLCTICLALLFW